MDAFSEADVERVVAMCSAQVGKTEIINNVVGFHIDQDPSPILVLQPTLDMASTWSKDRLAPMLRDSPCFKGKVRNPRSRDSDNTVLHKAFNGGHVTVTGANSPSSLASRPVRLVLCDEVDRYPVSAGSEGDPVDLAFKRATTFWNRKLAMVSTPTVRGESRIERSYESSDKRRYHVPCPHCAEFFVMKWTQVQWPEDEPEKAAYYCEHCGCEITDADKPAMLEQGRWIAEAPFNGTAGFWINELYSPWVTFGQMATDFVKKKMSPETLKTFINTSLAETWVEEGDAPKWNEVAALKMPYKKEEVPDGIATLTCGVDVQKNCLIFAVRGWGLSSSSSLIDFGELYGETDKEEVWSQLDGLLDKQYGDLPIKIMFIDSGYRADMVYAFCRRHPGQAIPTKGKATQDKPLKSTRIDVTVRGRTVKKGLQLWWIHTDYFKSWVHGRINWESSAPGAWHLPQDVTDDYCRQIVSESVIESSNGKRTWKATGANHFFDCEALNAAAAHLLRVDLMTLKPKSGAEPTKQKPVRANRNTGRSKGSWMKGWNK